MAALLLAAVLGAGGQPCVAPATVAIDASCSMRYDTEIEIRDGEMDVQRRRGASIKHLSTNAFSMECFNNM